MTVLLSKRKEGELLFLKNSKELQVLTEKILMNEKYVPKKYRYCWVQHVIKLSMDIFCDVRRANIIYPRNKELLYRRIRYLQRAEENTGALMSQIDIARLTQPSINKNVFIEWEKLAADTRKNIARRIKGDCENFKELV